MAKQEAEIRRLKVKLAEVVGHRPESSVSSHSEEDEQMCAVMHRSRRGKAPPMDAFTGENPEVRLDDWLPSFL